MSFRHGAPLYRDSREPPPLPHHQHAMLPPRDGYRDGDRGYGRDSRDRDSGRGRGERGGRGGDRGGRGGDRGGRGSRGGDRGGKAYGRSDNLEIDTLYVSGLAPDAREADLEKLFKPYGHVGLCVITKDRDGRSRGFGFVRLDTAELADKALQELNGITFMDRKLGVEKAKRRTEKGSHGSSGPPRRRRDEPYDRPPPPYDRRSPQRRPADGPYYEDRYAPPSYPGAPPYPQARGPPPLSHSSGARGREGGPHPQRPYGAPRPEYDVDAHRYPPRHDARVPGYPGREREEALKASTGRPPAESRYPPEPQYGARIPQNTYAPERPRPGDRITDLRREPPPRREEYAAKGGQSEFSNAPPPHHGGDMYFRSQDPSPHSREHPPVTNPAQQHSHYPSRDPYSQQTHAHPVVNPPPNEHNTYSAQSGKAPYDLPSHRRDAHTFQHHNITNPDPPQSGQSSGYDPLGGYVNAARGYTTYGTTSSETAPDHGAGYGASPRSSQPPEEHSQITSLLHSIAQYADASSGNSISQVVPPTGSNHSYYSQGQAQGGNYNNSQSTSGYIRHQPNAPNSSARYDPYSRY